ncbi:MAG TPA: hypothetical protein VGM84_10990 [Steroidobacteraceae bacterium]
MFHFVDDVATGAECLVAVASAHAHPHRHFANRKTAYAMHARSVVNTILCDGLGHDPLTLLDGEGFESLVFEVPNQVAFIVIPDQAFKRAIAAAGWVGKLIA